MYAFVAARLAVTQKHVKGGDKGWNEGVAVSLNSQNENKVGESVSEKRDRRDKDATSTTAGDNEKRDEVSSDEEKKNEQIGKEDNAKELMTDDADKRKKDDDDKAAPKVQDKSKPVSSTPVPGTPW